LFSSFKFLNPVLTAQTVITNRSISYTKEPESVSYTEEPKLVNYTKEKTSSYSKHINQKIRVLTFGEALFDIIKGTVHLGGAPLNLAAHLAKLGAKPAVLTAVGKDELGKILLSRAEEMGIETSYILTNEKRPTGTVTVELENGGIPIFTINEGVAWDAIVPDEGKFRALTEEEWDVFCFGTLAQRSEENRRTLQRLFSDVKTKYFFYDINLRAGFYKKEWILYSLEHCTILKMNEEEAAIISCMLFDTIYSCKVLCRLLIEKYPEISVICITKGPEGAAVYHQGVYEEVNTTPVKVADTVGAGDAFSAAFLYTYLSGHGVLKAASVACLLGTYVASKPGSVPEYSEELIKKLEIG
jgi:fructokinase